MLSHSQTTGGRFPSDADTGSDHGAFETEISIRVQGADLLYLALLLPHMPGGAAHGTTWASRGRRLLNGASRFFVQTTMGSRGSTKIDEDSPVERNVRRDYLVKKGFYESLSEEENSELLTLEAEIDAHLDRIAPLPWERLEQIERDLGLRGSDTP